MTDYSQHLIKTQQLIRLLYEDCQNLQYANAMETCLQAITELKLAYNAIHDLADKRHPNAMIGIWENK